MIKGEQKKKDGKNLFTIAFDTSSSGEYDASENGNSESSTVDEDIKIVTRTKQEESEGENPEFQRDSDPEDDVFMMKDDDPPAPTPVATIAPGPVPSRQQTRPIPRSQEPRSVATSVTPQVQDVPKSIEAGHIYVITREKRGVMKKLQFSIREDRREFAVTRTKKHWIEVWSVGSGVKMAPEFIIVAANEDRDFSLRKSSTDPADLMFIRFNRVRMPVDNARRASIFFQAPKDSGPLQLVTKNPTLNPDGKAVYDFGGRFAIDSVKNAVFAKDANGPPLLTVRKAGSDVLEVEMRFLHEPIWAFVVGVASFLSTTK